MSKKEIRSCVSVTAVTPVTVGSLCCAPDGSVLGRAINTAERGEQVGIRIVPESGQNVYNPHVQPTDEAREAAIAAGLEAATPGPWVYDHMGDVVTEKRETWPDHDRPLPKLVARLMDRDDPIYADATLVANAPSDIAYLLGALAEVRAERDEALRYNGTLDEAYEMGHDAGADEVLDRDKLAEVIDGYMESGGEFRSYDLADRIRRKLVPNEQAKILAEAAAPQDHGRDGG